MFATGHLSCSYLLFRLTGLSWPIRVAALRIEPGLEFRPLFLRPLRFPPHSSSDILMFSALVSALEIRG